MDSKLRVFTTAVQAKQIMPMKEHQERLQRSKCRHALPYAIQNKATIVLVPDQRDIGNNKMRSLPIFWDQISHVISKNFLKPLFIRKKRPIVKIQQTCGK